MLELLLFHTGAVDIARSAFAPWLAGAERDARVTSPVWSALLRTPEGNILFDTGLHPVHVVRPDATFGPQSGLNVVMKDEDGVVTTVAMEDLDKEGAAFAAIDVTEPGSLNHEDADEVKDDLPANSSALLIAFENIWARKVVSALEAADAVLIDSIRIPAEVVAQARAEAAAAG